MAERKKLKEPHPSLLDTVPVGIFRLDPDGDVIAANRIARELTDLTEEQVIAGGWRTRVHPDDFERVNKAFVHALKTREPWSLEHRILRRDGTERWVFVQLVADINADGTVREFVGALTDITENKRAQAAVKESAQRFQAMAEMLPETVFEFDAQGTVTFVNEAGLRMSQYDRDDFAAGFEMLRIIAPSDRASAAENLARIGAGDPPKPREYRLCRKDGSEFPGVIHIAAKQEGDRVVGGRGIIVDLSALRVAEKQKAELEAQLRRAQEAETLGALAGGVAHDMNNVLTVITSLASVTQREAQPSSTVHGDMQSILSACERGQSLTRNLLGFARRGKYRAERFSINEAIHDVVRLLERTIPKGITIETDLTDELLMVVGDSHQIGHVLLNLAINAVDAMGASGVLRFETTMVSPGAPELEKETDLAKGPHVRLRVIDDGSGMGADEVSRAFEPFFSTKKPSEGTGLGLSMVYGTVRSHQGTTLLTSEVGRGTTVTIYLPAVEPSVDDAEPLPAEPLAIQREGTVLLVDDDPLIRKSGRRLLKSLGFEVLLAAEGQEAILVYRQHREKIALVILDLMMPVMDGEQAFRRLRELDPELKIMLSSGFAQGEVAEALLAIGAQGFLEKPYTLTQLSEALSVAVPSAD